MENNDVELFESSDEIKIMQVCAILKDNNIPYIKIAEGSGGYTSILFGKTIENKKIIVSKENEEKARELIQFLLDK